MHIISPFYFGENYPNHKCHNYQPTETHSHSCYNFHISNMTVITVVSVTVSVTDIFKNQFSTVILYEMLKFPLGI